MDRPLVPVALFLVLGAALAVAPATAALLIPAGFAGACLADRPFRTSGRRALLLALAAGGVGFAWHAAVLHRRAAAAGDPLALAREGLGAASPDPDGFEVSLVGVVDGDWVREPDRHRAHFPLAVERLGARDAAAGGRVEVYVYDYVRRTGETPAGGDPRPGDRVAVSGRIFRPGSPGNPGEADFAREMRRRGVGALLSAAREDLAVVDPFARATPGILLARARRSLGDAVEAAAGGAPGGLARALVVGDRGPLRDADEAAFRRAGVSHILALSGFHLAILCGALLWVLRAFFGARPLVLGVTMAFGVAYAVLCGASAPLVRAAATGVCYLGAGMAHRRPDPGNVLAGGAIACVVIDPTEVTGAGFILTFAAVVGILLLYRPAREALLSIPVPAPLARGRAGKARRLVVAALATSVAAWLATSPAALYLFGGIAPVGPIATLALLPPTAAILVLGPIAALAGAISPALAAPFGLIVHGAGALALLTVDTLGHLPLGWMRAQPPSLVWLLAFYGALVVLARVHARREELLRPAVAACLVLLLVPGGGAATPPPAAGVRATTLDVGAGLAVIVRTPTGATLLYDCGSRSRYDVGARVVAPALRTCGIGAVDALILSHADDDHVNGARGLAAVMPVGIAYVAPGFSASLAGRRCLAGLAREGVPVGTLRRGMRLEGLGVTTEVLWPPADPPPGLSANDRSIVLRIGGPTGVLLTGDIGETATAFLLNRPEDLRAGALVAPHHGRSNPLAAQLGRAVWAEVLVISGDRDSVSSAALRGYAAGHARVLETWRCGASSVEAGAGVPVRSWDFRGAGADPPHREMPAVEEIASSRAPG